MQPAPERWWAYAERDLGTAQALIEAERWDAVSFFAQQAVEKAFKALLVQRGEKSPPRIHDLVVLGRRVGAPSTWEQESNELTRAYVVTRYPDAVVEAEGLGGIDQPMARRHLQLAEEVLEWAKGKLSTGS